MKINVRNKEKILATLKEVQKNATTRYFGYLSFSDLVFRGEDFLEKYPQKIRKGCIISNETLLPNSYKYSGEFTQVGIYRGNKDWFLVNCRRVTCNKAPYGDEKLTLYKTPAIYEWETNQIKMNVEI